jgi:DHA2 family multidrug resistance protein
MAAVQGSYSAMSGRFDPRELPMPRKLLIFGVMAFGMFMALIDIQIVAASLNDVQAGLSAGPDEISWVQTAYLMAELVMIPLSAFLAQAFSTRWLFAGSAALFTLSSVMCGLAWDIESMILFRALQGFTGGAMIPTAFSVGYVLFDEKQRAIIPASLGLAGVLAPALGPTVGGMITHWIDWRWIFFVNVAPGVIVTLAAFLLVRIDRPDIQRLRRLDWSHLAAMTVSLACLQYVLEEGPRKEWFGDREVSLAALAAMVAFGLFLERSFFSKNPIVNLSPFRNPTFVFACAFNLVIGFGIYASVYLMPIYLGRVRGLDSLEIGAIVFVVGAGQLVSTIIAAYASDKVDPRAIISIGLIGFAFSLWLTSFMTPDWGFRELLIPQLVRGGFFMLCIVPSVGMALGGFTGSELQFASALFNLMRNLGGAVGIAVVNTWLQDNARIHALRFGEALANNSAAGRDAAEELAQSFSAVTPDAAEAALMTQSVFANLVTTESLTLAFDDVFRLMAWMFVAALVMVPFCRPARNGAQAGAH